jgi:uncharacterized protein DUF5624
VLEVTTLAYAPHDFFRSLFEAYTGPGSTGQHLTEHMVRLTANEPIMVSTGSDYVIFPGGGRPPIVESFRLSTRGFVEMTAVSHLGPAVAWIFRMRELGDPAWRKDAERLMARMDDVRRINSESYWRDIAAVEAWRGEEAKITDLVEYSCDVTTSFLVRCLADESRMTPEYLLEAYLDPVSNSDVPVPINDMMVATFALAYLDIAQRTIRWLRTQNLDWDRLMVLIAGRSGRPTAGLTWATNNSCHLLGACRRKTCSSRRIRRRSPWPISATGRRSRNWKGSFVAYCSICAPTSISRGRCLSAIRHLPRASKSHR